MPKKPAKPKKPAARPKRRPFAVLEVGCGKVPTGLLGKAKNSVERGKTHRVFFGVDKGLDVGRLLKKARVKKLPENLFLAKGCAIRVLKDVKPGSLDIIFGSYLVNTLSANAASCALEGYTCESAFFQLAGRALKPGGRLVLVQDKANVPFLRNYAASFGAGFHSIEIPDNVARNSPAKYIKWKSSPELRRKRVREYVKRGEVTQGEVDEMVRHGAVENLQDFAKPTIIIIRKPRPGEESRRVVYLGPEQAFELLARLMGM